LPVYALIMGYATAKLTGLSWGRILLGLFLLMDVYIVADYYARPLMPTYHFYDRNFRTVGMYIKENAKSNDLIYLHLDHYSYLATRYYLGEADIPVESYYKNYHFEHFRQDQLLDYINQVNIWDELGKANRGGQNIWLVANDPREVTVPFSEHHLGYAVGTESDAVFDLRLLDLDKHFPDSHAIVVAGDVLCVIYIPGKLQP